MLYYKFEAYWTYSWYDVILIKSLYRHKFVIPKVLCIKHFLIVKEAFEWLNYKSEYNWIFHLFYSFKLSQLAGHKTLLLSTLIWQNWSQKSPSPKIQLLLFLYVPSEPSAENTNFVLPRGNRYFIIVYTNKYLETIKMYHYRWTC